MYNKLEERKIKGEKYVIDHKEGKEQFLKKEIAKGWQIKKHATRFWNKSKLMYQIYELNKDSKNNLDYSKIGQNTIQYDVYKKHLFGNTKVKSKIITCTHILIHT